MEYRYTLHRERDSLFIRFAPREGLWLQKLEAGDQIVCCSQCRKVFYSDDWHENNACPLCECGEPLYFLQANALLMRERAERGGMAVELPLRALRVRETAGRPPDGAPGEEAGAGEWDRLSALEDELKELKDMIRRVKKSGLSQWKWVPVAACVCYTALSAGQYLFQLL